MGWRRPSSKSRRDCVLPNPRGSSSEDKRDTPKGASCPYPVHTTCPRRHSVESASDRNPARAERSFAAFHKCSSGNWLSSLIINKDEFASPTRRTMSCIKEFEVKEVQSPPSSKRVARRVSGRRCDKRQKKGGGRQVDMPVVPVVSAQPLRVEMFDDFVTRLDNPRLRLAYAVLCGQMPADYEKRKSAGQLLPVEVFTRQELRAYARMFDYMKKNFGEDVPQVFEKMTEWISTSFSTVVDWIRKHVLAAVSGMGGKFIDRKSVV